MGLRHPFEWIADSNQKRVFIVLFIVTVVLMVGLDAVGTPLRTEEAPVGIISLEFAGNPSVAEGMIASWDRIGQVRAGISLGLDYLFLVAYASAIGLGCMLVVRTLPQKYRALSVTGVILAWSQLFAALLDAIENCALIQVLLGSQIRAWPAIAKWCAIPKFVIVGAGLVYILGGVLSSGVMGLSNRRRPANLPPME